MLRAIQFDCYAEFRTIKVDNIRTYSVLTAEFLSIKLRVLEILPEKRFGWR